MKNNYKNLGYDGNYRNFIDQEETKNDFYQNKNNHNYNYNKNNYKNNKKQKNDLFEVESEKSNYKDDFRRGDFIPPYKKDSSQPIRFNNRGC